MDFLIDLLSWVYPWTTAIHVMAVISWMAGIFYLPRLFVHHTEKVDVGSETDALFQMMEGKLYHVIMHPAGIVTWIFGLALVFTPGVVDWSSMWPWIKALCVIGMTVFHFWLGQQVKIFEAGENQRTGRNFRIMNEVPTILMIVIVIMVIVRPI